MTALFELVDASLLGPDRTLLEGIDWNIRARGVTVILGPAGTGKSTLLRSLAGRAPPGVELRGAWRFAGGSIEGAATKVALVTQRKAPNHGASLSWRDALSSTGAAVLLDEPTVGLSKDAAEDLVASVRLRADSGAVLIVTHDLSFAQSVADELAFFCAGRLVSSGAARGLFAAPNSDLLERFVRQGNSWPQPPPPKLPSHFHWILPGKLAGMGRPGLVGDEDADLLAIASAGVDLLVSLTEDPFPTAKLSAYGVRGRHFPITDMGIPPIGPTARLCRDLERELRESHIGVALHCYAGLGRTGTILAAMLVWLGRTPEDAVSEIRTHTSLYIQNGAQLDFVFAESCGPSRSP